MHPRLFQFGHFAIPTYGAFTALALVTALFALRYFARRMGLDANRVWNLGLIAILVTLVATRLLLVAVDFHGFARHPFWVLGLTASHATWVAAIAVAVGAGAAVLYALAEGLPILRVLDCVALAAALAIALNRVGAFLAGLDYGLPDTHAWGVVYTSLIATFWYGTPSGIRLYPVQMYEAAASLLVFIILARRLPRRAQDGELWGAWLFFYGAAGYFLAFYRAVDQTQWALRQPVAIAMVVVSAAFLLRRRSSVRL